MSVNPRAMFQRIYDIRELEKRGIGSIQAAIGDLQEKLNAVEKQLDKVSSPAFKWLCEEYLPSERRRIESERGTVPPGDVEKQCMVQGQLNEIDHIQNELPALRHIFSELSDRLQSARDAESRWHKKRGTKNK